MNRAGRPPGPNGPWKGSQRERDYRQSASFKASQLKHRIKAKAADPHKVWFSNLAGRAKQKGILFAIDPFEVPWPPFCPVLGIPIFPGDGRPSDNSPSADRIVPALGYRSGNVNVLSQRANRLKDDVEDPRELIAVAAYIYDQMPLRDLCTLAKDF